jgi:hypothetical protein
MSAPSQFGPTPPRSSGGMSVLVIVLIILGALVLVCGGLCAGCVYIGQQAASGIATMAELVPMQFNALAAIQEDQPAIDKLGEPIEIDGILERAGSGELKAAGEDFSFGVRGPKGTAKVKCTAVKDTGAWKLTVITLQTSDGTTLSVPPPEVSAPDMQFEVPEVPEETKLPEETKAPE